MPKNLPSQGFELPIVHVDARNYELLWSSRNDGMQKESPDWELMKSQWWEAILTSGLLAAGWVPTGPTEHNPQNLEFIGPTLKYFKIDLEHMHHPNSQGFTQHLIVNGNYWKVVLDCGGYPQPHPKPSLYCKWSLKGQRFCTATMQTIVLVVQVCFQLQLHFSFHLNIRWSWCSYSTSWRKNLTFTIIFLLIVTIPGVGTNALWILVKGLG